MTVHRCPALLVAAPASGAGKTTVTAALARRHRDRGGHVRVFKAGPDFLDPMILEQASGTPVYNLDLWMGGRDHCRALLHEAAGRADLILVEGVMGLFDGEPSSADLALELGLPVLAVIDGSAMAQSFGAVAQGLACYRPGISLTGVLANRLAGEAHYRMVADSLPPGLPARGWLPRDEGLGLPARHLGLFQPADIADCDARIARAAALLHEAPAPPPAVAFPPPGGAGIPRRLAGVRIAVARDAAFSFIYPANLDLLRALGAELAFFSPLADTDLPRAHALYLPGGYPELHLSRLAANEAMKRAVRDFHAGGGPVVAECGGMLYLLEALADSAGHSAAMAGVLPGTATVQERLANLGLHRVPLPEGELRGHTYHHSRMQCGLQPLIHSVAARHHGTPEPVYRAGRLTASYVHLYFPSNPEAAAGLFMPGGAAAECRRPLRAAETTP